MTLYITYCSKKKLESDSNLTAVERYNSERIDRVYQKSLDDGEDFAILSGKYGMVKPEEQIPYYDKLLQPEETNILEKEVRKFLNKEEVSEVVYYTRPMNEIRERYYTCIEQACEEAGLELEKEILD